MSGDDFSVMGVWSEELQCGWRAVEALDALTVVITVPDRHATDMRGAVSFARRLNPNVRAIVIKQLDKPCHLYSRAEGRSGEDISDWTSGRLS